MGRCIAKTAKGVQCKKAALQDKEICNIHLHTDKPAKATKAKAVKATKAKAVKAKPAKATKAVKAKVDKAKVVKAKATKVDKAKFYFVANTRGYEDKLYDDDSRMDVDYVGYTHENMAKLGATLIFVKSEKDEWEIESITAKESVAIKNFDKKIGKADYYAVFRVTKETPVSQLIKAIDYCRTFGVQVDVTKTVDGLRFEYRKLDAENG